MSRRIGDRFQEDIEKSCESQGIFNHRIKDVTPNMLRPNIRISPNKYDYFAFMNGHLFTLELKTTQSKSLSFSEKIVKPHQIKALTKAATYEDVISGFIINFREYDNQTFFLHINDYNTYRNTMENNLDHSYKSKTNEKSIPLDICKEIGVEIFNVKKRTRYTYGMKVLFDELIDRYRKKGE